LGDCHYLCTAVASEPLGSGFRQSENAAGLERHEQIDVLNHTLGGSFTHTILERSAFCIAIFVAILAFLHFSITRDVTTPVIGVALFCAGAMDAFHTLAADRLIDAVAYNLNLIPFTWAICRLFNAMIMIGGVGIFLIWPIETRKTGFRFVAVTSLVFGVVAYFVIHTSFSVSDTRLLNRCTNAANSNRLTLGALRCGLKTGIKSI